MCAYLGCLRGAGYVYSAGFDTAGFGPFEECKPALPSAAVPIGQRAIIPAEREGVRSSNENTCTQHIPSIQPQATGGEQNRHKHSQKQKQTKAVRQIFNLMLF